EHPVTAQSLNELGAVLRVQGKYTEAQDYVENALRIRRRLLGEEHPVTAQSLNDLGYLLYSVHDYCAARECFSEALKIRKKIFGAANPCTLRSRRILDLVENFAPYDGVDD
ncbi:tetratricopeptide repeat protein, partial [Streptomyces pseudogriseolus]